MREQFSRKFLEKTQLSCLIEIRLVEDELFHVDEQIDVTKLETTFRNFAKAPKNLSLISVTTCLNAMLQLLKMTGFCEHGQIPIRGKGSLGDILVLGR